MTLINFTNCSLQFDNGSHAITFREEGKPNPSLTVLQFTSHDDDASSSLQRVSFSLVIHFVSIQLLMLSSSRGGISHSALLVSRVFCAILLLPSSSWKKREEGTFPRLCKARSKKKKTTTDSVAKLKLDCRAKRLSYSPRNSCLILF